MTAPSKSAPERQTYTHDKLVNECARSYRTGLESERAFVVSYLKRRGLIAIAEAIASERHRPQRQVTP